MAVFLSGRCELSLAAPVDPAESLADVWLLLGLSKAELCFLDSGCPKDIFPCSPLAAPLPPWGTLHGGQRSCDSSLPFGLGRLCGSREDAEPQSREIICPRPYSWKVGEPRYQCKSAGTFQRRESTRSTNLPQETVHIFNRYPCRLRCAPRIEDYCF